ncbi:MAG: F0F1 ATP synthase subunit I' [Candidatus Desulfovibrio kirbyi]|uniref:F0F1 ATP synthase subunit I n=1 Tax=Candidatus Desulfovibrio kirbyi TaxID=2696086 RepID=A0A6L2R4I5_9BACT|nr:MAG: F0F1 ATP synthase subunit I' [Candidatus Desulfovibrio kirbyi]
MFAGSAALRGLDAWLCRRGITHPMVIPLVRNELLLMFVFLLAGSAFLSLTPWFFWFGVGIGVMALVFWGLARFFLRTGFTGYSTALLFSVLLRWVARLALVGTVAYTALIVFKAPPSALLGGLTAGVAGAFVTFAMVRQKV